MACKNQFYKMCFRPRAAKVVGIVFTLMAIPFAAHAEADDAANAARRSHAMLDFRIVIPPVLKVKSLTVPSTLLVEQADIDRGYVEVNDASSLAVMTNSRDGFMLSAQIDSRLLERAEVRITNHTLHAAGDLSSMVVKLPARYHDRVGVSYRLYLAKHACAGIHRWPVALTFSQQAI
jgi:hypothetical protein